MTRPVIDIRSLRVDYETTTAVHDLDLAVGRGEVYGLVGPNGAGKTSTIRAIARIIEPTYGDVVLDGVDMQVDPEKAWRRLGYMPDFPPVYSDLKVWEYLDVFGAAHRIPRSKRRRQIHRWLEKLELTTKSQAFIRDLSRGMRQRLSFAKALIHEPTVLLLDEPASGMDPISRVLIREILKELAGRGVTTLISSHILTELSDFCTAVGIMEKGTLAASGSLDELRAQTQSGIRLVIRLARPDEGEDERLQRILTARTDISPPHEAPRKPGEFEAAFRGDEDAAALLLAELVQNDLPVCEFRLVKEDIEDIFLKIGAKEIA